MRRSIPTTSSGGSENFIDMVQEHERTWGTETYPNRPTLSDLLSASIVAWWLPVKNNEQRKYATVHEDLEALNKYASRLLLHSRTELPDRRLLMIHINQKKAVIRGVSLQIVGIDEGK